MPDSGTPCDDCGFLPRPTVRHPSLWALLNLPRSATIGFVTLALTFRASEAGISVMDTSFLTASVLLNGWLKWIWAPVVDVTLSPKRWFAVGLATCIAGIAILCALPITSSTLPIMIGVVAVLGMVSSFLPMSLEAMVAATTTPEDRSRVAGWFQVGNLAGTSLGGGVGLMLLETLEQPWIAGAIFAGSFALCGLAIFAVPFVERNPGSPREAIREVFVDLRNLARTKGGVVASLLSFLPIATGAGASMLSQAKVAAAWHAGAGDVELVQGYAGSAVTALGCLAVGRLGTRFRGRQLYMVISLVFAGVSLAMAAAPATRASYLAWTLAYQFAYGMAFAGFMLFVLEAMGHGTAATKYSIYASLSNFPTWWLGLTLGRIADVSDPFAALAAEGAIGVGGVVAVFLAARWIRTTSLPDALPDAA